jgi:hypothetical protein
VQDRGPTGEQVRTFIVGDDLAATVAALEARIDYILDALETLVLPVEPRKAFELLALLVQRDGDAMERCGEHHGSVASVFERWPDFAFRGHNVVNQRPKRAGLRLVR